MKIEVIMHTTNYIFKFWLLLVLNESVQFKNELYGFLNIKLSCSNLYLINYILGKI